MAGAAGGMLGLKWVLTTTTADRPRQCGSVGREAGRTTATTTSQGVPAFPAPGSVPHGPAWELSRQTASDAHSRTRMFTRCTRSD